MDCSLPGSFLHGILQARILEWVAISISISFSFLTQGSNPGLLHWRQMLLPLSHKGSLVICPQLILQSLPLFQTLLCHLLELLLQNLQSSPSPLHILIEFWFGSEDTTSLVFTIFSPSCELHGQEEKLTFFVLSFRAPSLFKTHAITLFSSPLLVSSDILLTLLLSSKTLAPDSQSTLLAQSLLFICLMTTFTLMNHHHCHRLAPMLFSILALQSLSKSNSWGLPWTNALKNPPLLFNYTHYNYFKLLLDFPVLCFLYVFYFSHYQVDIL